ncbi:hypothetical protein B0H17DRAFT_1069065 [Mycena rosella]|uniref:Uncharacterized protein n=1 Tax=Mycena rosella TaxID=1033263 RepID=A0AAD7GHF5_MYCRO|nr:hypothetical protein B0H17DRAFT_1069065 [Mycena rosella]
MALLPAARPKLALALASLSLSFPSFVRAPVDSAFLTGAPTLVAAAVIVGGAARTAVPGPFAAVAAVGAAYPPVLALRVRPPDVEVDVDADADEDAALDAVLIRGADSEEAAGGGIVLLLVLASLARADAAGDEADTDACLARGVNGDTGDAPGFSICVCVCAAGFVVVARVVTLAVRMRLAIVVPALDAIFFAGCGCGCGAVPTDGGRRRERGGGSGAAAMWRGVKTQA